MNPENSSSVPVVIDHTLALVSHSPQETRHLGARLAAVLGPGDVIALQGELGSGKTQFVKGLARGLGIPESVHSPTFILANEYRSGRLPLFHVDAYRVANAGEAIGFGLDDYLNDVGLTAIEWAERIQAALPAELLWIEFRHLNEKERAISIQARGRHYEQLLEEFALLLTSGPFSLSRMPFRSEEGRGDGR